jgi:uncharacterized protein YndB with AHSA1/START domain
MIRHEIAVQLAHPVEQVFDFLVNPRNLPSWQSDLIEIEQLTAGPLRAGTQIREVRRQGPRQAENRAEVQVFEPNKRFTLKTTTQPQVTVSYSFEPHQGGTRLTYEFALLTSGLMRLLEPLISGAIKKQSGQDFEKLKQVLKSA